MANISSLDLGYEVPTVKHFDPEFVRAVNNVKIHDWRLAQLCLKANGQRQVALALTQKGR